MFELALGDGVGNRAVQLESQWAADLGQMQALPRNVQSSWIEVCSWIKPLGTVEPKGLGWGPEVRSVTAGTSLLVCLQAGHHQGSKILSFLVKAGSDLRITCFLSAVILSSLTT